MFVVRSDGQERAVHRTHKQWIWLGALLLMLSWGSPLAAQPQTSRAGASTPTAKANTTPASEEDISATRDQLFQLLKMSPKLTTVVIRDPSLLSDEGYVSRNNPQLA